MNKLIDIFGCLWESEHNIKPTRIVDKIWDFGYSKNEDLFDGNAWTKTGSERQNDIRRLEQKEPVADNRTVIFGDW